MQYFSCLYLVLLNGKIKYFSYRIILKKVYLFLIFLIVVGKVELLLLCKEIKIKLILVHKYYHNNNLLIYPHCQLKPDKVYKIINFYISTIKWN